MCCISRFICFSHISYPLTKYLFENIVFVGCMNNITFGNEKGGYYETVGGGAGWWWSLLFLLILFLFLNPIIKGAGPTWHGRSGVHTHMTNTRITGIVSLLFFFYF